MQATDAFTEIITSHLQKVAETDLLFAETLKKPTKNIKDCITYIMNTVKSSGKNGFADDEVFGMAIHYYDEDNIKVGGAVQGKVVVNHAVESIKQSFASPIETMVVKKVIKKQTVTNQPSLF